MGLNHYVRGGSLRTKAPPAQAAGGYALRGPLYLPDAGVSQSDSGVVRPGFLPWELAWSMTPQGGHQFPSTFLSLDNSPRIHPPPEFTKAETTDASLLLY